MSEECECLFKDPIPDELICPCCQEIFKKPTFLPCKHSFCAACIEHWHLLNKTCPLCRNKFRKNQIKRDLCNEAKMESLLVLCNFTGCNWVGAVSEVTEHMKICCFNEKNIGKWASEYLKDGEGLFAELYLKFGETLKPLMSNEDGSIKVKGIEDQFGLKRRKIEELV